MPYEYRSMSREEREEVLRQRREAGYPLHAPPHPFRNAGYYFITGANFEHQHIMSSPERRTEFEGRLALGLKEINADAAGWVVLPNHYHFLAGVETLDDISAMLKRLHGGTAHDWNLADGLTGRRRVWYKFADRFIRDERNYFSALNYIHTNPVKHGYTSDPYDWPWMSLQNYCDAHGREWLREKWKSFPPGDFGQGCDD